MQNITFFIARAWKYGLMFANMLLLCVAEFKRCCTSFVTLDHKTSHKGPFNFFEKSWIKKLSIDVWFGNIWLRYNYFKICNLRVQKKSWILRKSPLGSRTLKQMDYSSRRPHRGGGGGGGLMYSALSSFNTTTEVLLSKAPNPQLLPGRRSINGCPLLRVCVHSVCVFTAVWVHFGRVKCRAKILSMGHHTWSYVTLLSYIYIYICI